MYSIGEVSKMAGVSARNAALLRSGRAFDALGRHRRGLPPVRRRALAELSQILFFRELDFPIDDIRRIRSRPDYDARQALEKQAALLEMQRDRLDRLIALAGRALKGEVIMELNAFDMSRIEEAKHEYAQEARERWGDTQAYAQSEARTRGYGKADWRESTGKPGRYSKAFRSSSAPRRTARKRKSS